MNSDLKNILPSGRWQAIRSALTMISSRLSRRTLLMAIGAIVVIAVGIFGYRSLWSQPKIIFPNGAALGVTEVSDTKPVVIVFNRPINQASLSYAIHPELQGNWTVESHVLATTSTLTFTPAESPDFDTRYTISLEGIKSVLGSRAEKYLLSFQTDALPIITDINPVDGASEVLPNSPIVLTADKMLPEGVTFTVALTPEIAFERAVVSDKTITFPHTAQFQKGATYALKVYLSTSRIDYATKAETNATEQAEIMAAAFSTVAAPGIQANQPTGSGVDPAATIQLEFKQPMEPTSTAAALAISPAVPGALTWENDRKMIYTPTAPLTKGQEYTVTLAASAAGVSGFTFDQVFTWGFTTIGTVTATLSPKNGATGVDNATAVNIAFNQAVDHASAENKFSIAPTVAGAFSWTGNTLIFQPAAALAHGTAYTVTIAPGVTSIKGNDSVAAFSSKFTTRVQSVMLKVPAYAQTHVYSCMIAAARSALAFRGVSVTESNIISKVGRDSTSWSGTWGGSNGVWGDPESDIVGPLDNGAATSPAGKTTTNVYWGYGSHWGPISSALTSYGVANEVRTGLTVQDLAQSLSDGNPIIIWWVNGIWPSYEVNWKTPGGKSIRGVNGLHVQVVRGFTGSVENPVSFTVTDSGYGYPGRAYDVGTFKAKWSWFGNTGIIVR